MKFWYLLHKATFYTCIRSYLVELEALANLVCGPTYCHILYIYVHVRAAKYMGVHCAVSS